MQKGKKLVIKPFVHYRIPTSILSSKKKTMTYVNTRQVIHHTNNGFCFFWEHLIVNFCSIFSISMWTDVTNMWWLRLLNKKVLIFTTKEGTQNNYLIIKDAKRLRKKISLNDSSFFNILFASTNNINLYTLYIYSVTLAVVAGRKCSDRKCKLDP